MRCVDDKGTGQFNLGAYCNPKVDELTVKIQSETDQGKRNVSHGCINLSPANAKWFYDNFGSGDPIVVKNSVGLYTKPDGADDWQWTLY
jgi:hypothetical protein